MPAFIKFMTGVGACLSRRDFGYLAHRITTKTKKARFPSLGPDLLLMPVTTYVTAAL